MKSLQTQWEEYHQALVDQHNLSTEELLDCRRNFFVGATAAIDSLGNIFDECKTSEEASAAYDKLLTELVIFSEVVGTEQDTLDFRTDRQC